MAGFGESRIEVELIWHDDVLVEIDARIITPQWRGHGITYTTEEDLLEFASRASEFADGTTQPVRFQAGYADRSPTIRMRLSEISLNGRIACCVDLHNADTHPSINDYPFTISAAIATEAEAVRRFSRQLDTMVSNRRGMSVLLGE